MKVTAEHVTLEVEGAGRMMAHVARSACATRGGILLLQEAIGLTSYSRLAAARSWALAETFLAERLGA